MIRNNGITEELYSFIIQEWKNTSLLKNKKSSKPSFKAFLNDVIYYAQKKSACFFTSDTLYMVKEIALGNNFSNIDELLKNMKKIDDAKADMDIDIFLDELLVHLASKYEGIEKLLPHGWESSSISSILDLEKFLKKPKEERLKNFKGLEFNDGTLEFYDSVSLSCAALAYREESLPPYKILCASIIGYCFKYNELVNDSIIKNNLKSDNKKSNLMENLEHFYNFENLKIDFEVKKEEVTKKVALDSLLNRLSKN